MFVHSYWGCGTKPAKKHLSEEGENDKNTKIEFSLTLKKKEDGYMVKCD